MAGTLQEPTFLVVAEDVLPLQFVPFGKGGEQDWDGLSEVVPPGRCLGPVASEPGEVGRELARAWGVRNRVLLDLLGSV